MSCPLCVDFVGIRILGLRCSWGHSENQDYIKVFSVSRVTCHRYGREGRKVEGKQKKQGREGRREGAK